jgi:16S rRNA (adenine1518-N6/adenine1519-N6)-dimethyltransferase
MAMTSIKRELAEYGFTPKKRWGQHFLIDRNILNKVIRTADLGKGDVVLEVGPGLGEMTLVLARQVKKVIAVEIDSKLVGILRKKTSGSSNVEIIERDILKVNFKQLHKQEGQRLAVVANLPYQISTPLLFRFIESKEVFSTLTLMLQREVAERMVASPGRKEYGPLSVFVQSVFDLSIRFFIKPSAFFPAPKVDSAVIHMVWKKSPMLGLEEAWFKEVVRGCFGYRRKRLVNALRHSDVPLPIDLEQRVEKIGIDPQRRPETLTIQEFARLAEAVRP